MRYAWNKETLIALLATLAFATAVVGCGPKSGSSNDRPAAPTDQAVATPEAQSESQPADDEESKDSNNFDPYQDKATLDGDGQTHTKKRVLEKSNPTWGEPDESNDSPYEVIEKDRIYGQSNLNKTRSSSHRLGEFGAVMTQDSMWYPGLPDYPAGHRLSKIQPIFTGGKSQSEYRFTDGKSDDLMAYAVAQFNLIKDRQKANPDRYQPDILNESRVLAQRIQKVALQVDMYNNSEVRLEVAFADGNVRRPVNTLFKGKINGLRLAELQQVNIKGDLDLTFEAQVMCMDKDGGCQNAVIQLAQVKDGKICRIAYVVHRSGDAHITMSDRDLLHYSASENPAYRAIAVYFGNTTYNACLVNRNRSDFPNRLIQHLRAYCGDRSRKKTPAAQTIGYKTWASAYGASAFSLEFKDEPKFYDDQSRAGFAIQGPLVFANDKNPIFSNKLAVVSQRSSANYIGSAHLVNNDAGGNLNILLRFNGTDKAELRFSVTSLLRQTLAPDKVPSAERLPEDPRG